MGTGLDAAVQAVADPKNKRHGPLHVAAGTKYLEMCKMLVKKYNCNPNAAGADGTLHSVSALISAWVCFFSGLELDLGCIPLFDFDRAFLRGFELGGMRIDMMARVPLSQSFNLRWLLEAWECA